MTAERRRIVSATALGSAFAAGLSLFILAFSYLFDLGAYGLAVPISIEAGVLLYPVFRHRWSIFNVLIGCWIVSSLALALIMESSNPWKMVVGGLTFGLLTIVSMELTRIKADPEDIAIVQISEEEGRQRYYCEECEE